MARIKSVAAVIAVLMLPVLAALTGLALAPDAAPPNVPATVRIGETNTPRPTTSTPTPTTTATTPPSSSPKPPPPIDDDDDDDGDDDGDG